MRPWFTRGKSSCAMSTAGEQKRRRAEKAEWRRFVDVILNHRLLIDPE